MKPLHTLLCESEAGKYTPEQILKLLKLMHDNLEKVRDILLASGNIDGQNTGAMIGNLMHAEDAPAGLNQVMSDYEHKVEQLLLVSDKIEKALENLRGQAQKAGQGSSNIEQRITQAVLKLGGNKTRQRVRIADLAEELPDIPKQALDKALKDLQIKKKVVLYRLDNLRDKKPRDDAAAVDINGNERHLVFLTDD